MASSFSKVIKSLKKFPGIGNKSAERIAFYFLETNREETKNFIHCLKDLLEKTVFCKNCGLISEQSPCRICSSPKRDHSIICVVKNIQDAIHIERSKSYFGQYHILGGLLSPLSHVYENDLKINSLLERIQNATNKKAEKIQEIIFALEQSTEANVTIQLIQEKIQNFSFQENKNQILFSRMAVGIPIGTGLEYIDGNTLKQSLKNRYQFTQNNT